MDENSPCLTFLHRDAAFQSRLYASKHGKKRLSARDLLSACVRLVDDYNCEALPDIAPDEHAKALMPTLHVSNEQDEIFLTQVLYGCCRYKKLLEVLTAKLFVFKSPNIQCVDETLYMVLGYLALIRLEELTFNNFRKFVLSQHPQKLLSFVQFMFIPEDISIACKHEWTKIYDVQYVDDLIKRLSSWRGEAELLSKRLEDKILLIKHREKRSTPFKPFNLSASREIPLIEQENKALPFKAKPLPKWKEGPTTTQKALETACQASREKHAKYYASPKNQPFHLHILERPSRIAVVKEQVESMRRLETEYIAPKAHPCPDPPTTKVKLTTSSVLREHAVYEKQLKQEEDNIKAFEVNLRNDYEFKSWQEEGRLKEQGREALERKLRKATVDACDQAVADARYAKVQENREKVKRMKEEAQKLDVLKEECSVNLELFNRLRRENIVEGQQAVKLALLRVAELKKARAREIQAETQKLAFVDTNKRAAELARKKGFVQQLHALQMDSAQIMKKFDRDSTSGHGLLGEMSISELQEHLVLVKQAIKKEEEYRRIRIHASKEENANKLHKKSLLVKKMRQIAHAQKVAQNGHA